MYLPKEERGKVRSCQCRRRREECYNPIDKQIIAINSKTGVAKGIVYIFPFGTVPLVTALGPLDVCNTFAKITPKLLGSFE